MQIRLNIRINTEAMFKNCAGTTTDTAVEAAAAAAATEATTTHDADPPGGGGRKVRNKLVARRIGCFFSVKFGFWCFHYV